MITTKLVHLVSPLSLCICFGLSLFLPSFGQDPAVDKQKFVLLNNGATVGMVIKSVMKADQQRLKLTDQQVPKAQAIITQAVVAFNEGVKQLKSSGFTQKKLRALAIKVETDKVRAYKAILTPEQYAILATQHKRIYPESKV